MFEGLAPCPRQSFVHPSSSTLLVDALVGVAGDLVREIALKRTTTLAGLKAKVQAMGMR
jgi:hypothetical protein